MLLIAPVGAGFGVLLGTEITPITVSITILGALYFTVIAYL
jgi:hypothetical protein